jgi:hypothetical protein
MKPIIRVVMIAVAIAVGVAWYVHWSRNRALNSGDVFVREGDKTRPETPNSGNQSAQPQEVADNGAGASGSTPAIPTSDSLPRSAPNGIVMARPGRYQLYRQGDITWRLDTDTGFSCALFATEAQWRKTIVYDHGCDSR